MAIDVADVSSAANAAVTFQCQLPALTEALATVQGAVGKALAARGILIARDDDALVVTADNWATRIAVRVPGSASADVPLVIDHYELSRALKAMAKTKGTAAATLVAEISASDPLHVALTVGTRSVELQRYPLEDFRQASPTTTSLVEVDRLEFTTALTNALAAASTEKVLPMNHCVKFTISEDEIVLRATDRYRLCIASVATKHATSTHREFVVDRQILADVVGHLPGPSVELGLLNDTTLVMISGDVTVVTRLADVTTPDIDRFVPTTAACAVTVDRKALLAAATCAGRLHQALGEPHGQFELVVSTDTVAAVPLATGKLSADGPPLAAQVVGDAPDYPVILTSRFLVELLEQFACERVTLHLGERRRTVVAITEPSIALSQRGATIYALMLVRPRPDEATARSTDDDLRPNLLEFACNSGVLAAAVETAALAIDKQAARQPLRGVLLTAHGDGVRLTTAVREARTAADVTARVQAGKLAVLVDAVELVAVLTAIRETYPARKRSGLTATVVARDATTVILKLAGHTVPLTTYEASGDFGRPAAPPVLAEVPGVSFARAVQHVADVAQAKTQRPWSGSVRLDRDGGALVLAAMDGVHLAVARATGSASGPEVDGTWIGHELLRAIAKLVGTQTVRVGWGVVRDADVVSFAFGSATVVVRRSTTSDETLRRILPTWATATAVVDLQVLLQGLEWATKTLTAKGVRPADHRVSLVVTTTGVTIAPRLKDEIDVPEEPAVVRGVVGTISVELPPRRLRTALKAFGRATVTLHFAEPPTRIVVTELPQLPANEWAASEWAACHLLVVKPLDDQAA